MRFYDKFKHWEPEMKRKIKLMINLIVDLILLVVTISLLFVLNVDLFSKELNIFLLILIPIWVSGISFFLAEILFMNMNISKQSEETTSIIIKKITASLMINGKIEEIEMPINKSLEEYVKDERF